MYNEKTDKLIQTLRRRMKNYDHPVAKNTWNEIERDLKTLKHRRILRRTVLTAAAAVVAGLISLPLFVRDDGAKITKSPIAATEYTSNVANGSGAVANSPGNVANGSGIVANNSGSVVNGTGTVANSLGNVANGTGSVADSSGKGSEQYLVVTETEEKHREQTNGQTTETKNQTIDLQIDKIPEADKTGGKTDKKKKRLAFSLAMGNSPVSNGSGNKHDYVMMNEVANNSIEKTVPSSYPFDFEASDIRYAPPLSAGMLVRKYLSKHWSLESGLVYTYLYSIETSGNVERRTSLHYVGIPLSAVHTFFESNRLSLYASAGGMYEILLSGNEKYNLDVPSKKPDVSQVQWSVFGGFGIDCKIAKPLSIFVEPDAVFYFDDGGGIKTIRKSVPLNFNLRVGLRLTY